MGSRLIAKVSSAKAKPNGVFWIVPGQEAKFLAPLDVREIPGVGKVTEKNLHGLGIKKVGDLARFEEAELEERFGKWGLALAARRAGRCRRMVRRRSGRRHRSRSRSATNTLTTKTPPTRTSLKSTLMRLSEMVGRRLREAELHARTIQLKLRYKDFTTITRAHTLAAPTQLDTRNL